MVISLFFPFLPFKRQVLTVQPRLPSLALPILLPQPPEGWNYSYHHHAWHKNQS